MRGGTRDAGATRRRRAALARRASRSGFPSRPASAGSSSDAATALELANDAARRAAARRGARAARRVARRGRPVLPPPRSAARHGRRDDAASARRCRATTPSLLVLPAGRDEGVDERRSTRAFDERAGERGLRRAPRRTPGGARRSSGRRADLAALPPNDLASSPLADELVGLGAFRADVTGAGPVVYGLFADRADAVRAAAALEARATTWIAASRLILSAHGERAPDRARREPSRASRAAQPLQGRPRDRGGRGDPRAHRRDPVVAGRRARARSAGGVRRAGAGTHESADVRVVTWTAAVSQLVVVLVPVLAGALVVLVAVVVVACAALALAALLLDRR